MTTASSASFWWRAVDVAVEFILGVPISFDSRSFGQGTILCCALKSTDRPAKYWITNCQR